MSMAAGLKYELEDLLRVRLLREDAAARQMARRKAVLAELYNELETRKRELAEFQRWRQRREAELYAAIMEQEIHPRELDKLHHRLQKLRADENSHQAKVTETTERIQKEEQALEVDRQEYFKAYRNRDKLDQHKSLWIRDARKAQELAEEKESEDFKNRLGSLAATGV